MNKATAPLSLPKAGTSLQRIHAFLTVQSVVVILVSMNRLSTLTAGYVAANEFLRWVDLLNMLVLPLVSLVAFYLVKKELEKRAEGDGRLHLLLNLTFIIGVYLLGASYGDHEVTNYLHTRFCPGGPVNDLCRIVIFNDDQFSHWVFFSGFVMVNVALLLLQLLLPYRAPLQRRDLAFLVANGSLIGLGVLPTWRLSRSGWICMSLPCWLW